MALKMMKCFMLKPDSTIKYWGKKCIFNVNTGKQDTLLKRWGGGGEIPMDIEGLISTVRVLSTLYFKRNLQFHYESSQILGKLTNHYLVIQKATIQPYYL